MELKEGMFVRTDNGIGKYIGYNEMEFWDGKGKATYREFLKEPSYNIIDIIEVGDYVNGLLVTRICEDIETNEKYINLYGSISEWEEEDVKSIVTKEQFSQISYNLPKDK